MAACLDIDHEVRGLQARLMGQASGKPGDQRLACIIASWSCGAGALPAWLGLGAEGFAALMAHYFGGTRVPPRGSGPALVSDPARLDELADLRALLLAHRAGQSPSEVWIAEIVVQACMGSDHLWQDLGLWSRGDLSALMREHFPGLAARNDRDMKWKKFLYKQLCEAESCYVCRAPSCEVCADYASCFGPED
jgi:nitrogen fixation protein NifQ